MNVIDEGREQLRRANQEAEERERYWRDQNREHTIAWFYRDFYEHHYIPNPDYNPHVFAPRSNPRRIVDPARPLPEIIGWRTIEPGDLRAASTFICEGMEFICRWEWRGGSDRAYWDDGWWPEWFLVRKGWFRRREVQVHGPQSIAEDA